MTTRKQQTPARKRARASTRTPPRRRPGARAKAAPAAGRAARPAERTVTLSVECTVAEADALKSQLTRRLEEPGPVIVDVSALQRIDTAGLQLLAAFVRDRRTAGRAIAWSGRAAALDTAAGLLGLSDMLELGGEVHR